MKIKFKCEICVAEILAKSPCLYVLDVNPELNVNNMKLDIQKNKHCLLTGEEFAVWEEVEE